MGEARTIHSLYASRLLSCLSSIPLVSPSRYCRARARIWDTVFHYRVRNKSFVPRDRHWRENSNLEAALFVPARVPRYVSAWDYKSSDRNTYEVKRVCTNKCQIKSRKNEIQTNWQYEANCVLFSRNWINKTPYVYAWKDSGDDCFVNMVGQLVIATRWLITKGSRRYSAEKKEGRAPRRGRDLRERWIKKTWEVWTIH